MSKRVRIENADGGNRRVLVEVWQRGYPDGTPDKLIESRVLSQPADLGEFTIHAGRFITVSETGPVSGDRNT